MSTVKILIAGNAKKCHWLTKISIFKLFVVLSFDNNRFDFSIKIPTKDFHNLANQTIENWIFCSLHQIPDSQKIPRTAISIISVFKLLFLRENGFDFFHESVIWILLLLEENLFKHRSNWSLNQTSDIPKKVQKCNIFDLSRYKNSFSP